MSIGSKLQLDVTTIRKCSNQISRIIFFNFLFLPVSTTEIMQSELRWKFCVETCLITWKINVIPVSPKRTRIFSETVSDLHSLSRRNLRPLCPTRWTTRYEAIDILLQNYDAVMTTLKGKEKKGKGNIYLHNAILVCHTHKALRHGSHRYACKLHHACLSFVKVHLMAPPLTEAADIQLQLTTYRHRRVKGWVGLVGWPTADGLP